MNRYYSGADEEPRIALDGMRGSRAAAMVKPDAAPRGLAHSMRSPTPAMSRARQ
jgi:hypothetical protein